MRCDAGAFPGRAPAAVGRTPTAVRKGSAKQMYQPYPGATEVPTVQRPAAPSPVRSAVVIMYAGAAVSLIRLIADLATRASLKADIEKAPHGAVPLTAHQVSAAVTVSIAAAVVLGLISVGLWILNARGCAAGRKWAQVTGTVLFGLGTLSLLAGPPGFGLAANQPAVARVCTVLVWLAGLGAVVRLWQRSSRDFFNGRQP
jgi:hypothetical protein